MEAYTFHPSIISTNENNRCCSHKSNNKWQSKPLEHIKREESYFLISCIHRLIFQILSQQMEIDESKLRTLSMKAWSWVDKISDEIENESTIVCRHCSEHRLRHGIAESPLLEEQKQRLIAIKDSLKDSLKDVDNMLVVLQVCRSLPCI